MARWIVILITVIGAASAADAQSYNSSGSSSMPGIAPSSGPVGGGAMPHAAPIVQQASPSVPPQLTASICLTAIGACAIGPGPINSSCYCNTPTGPALGYAR
jgi:hypothetical protein